jgi:hypothetical protein
LSFIENAEEQPIALSRVLVGLKYSEIFYGNRLKIKRAKRALELQCLGIFLANSAEATRAWTGFGRLEEFSLI